MHGSLIVKVASIIIWFVPLFVVLIALRITAWRRQPRVDALRLSFYYIIGSIAWINFYFVLSQFIFTQPSHKLEQPSYPDSVVCCVVSYVQTACAIAVLLIVWTAMFVIRLISLNIYRRLLVWLHVTDSE